MPKHNLHSVKPELSPNPDRRKKTISMDEAFGDDPVYQQVKKEFVEKVEAVQHSNSIVAVRSMVDAKINATGYVTGNVYVFNGAGSTVDVDERDVENLLQKRRGKGSCCGNDGKGQPMFALA